MKTYNLSAIFGAAALSIAAVSPAQAYSWTYGIDSFNDGVTNGIVGNGGTYEFYGMAVAEDDNNIFLALNSNFALTGAANSGAQDKHIGWGDLFLNFTGKGYNDAIASGEMLAIHLAGTYSDSGEQENGLYKVNTAQGVASTNSGFNTLNDHKNKVTKAGKTATVGNVDYTNYFAMGSTMKNVMLDGDKIGNISFLDTSGLGLDFASKGAIGSQTIALSFSKADLPGGLSGDLIATIFAECNNDGVGVVAKVNPSVPEPPSESVPEPASVLGLITIASSALGLRRRRA
ncbi:MAG: PEP-CTERM sorting domain-containing protein [Oscillatoriales cyanobacterium]|nr:MAG: PEP-CTERM sorting domain-containing protein [Oscillatoriales cyanobacterium]